MRGTCSAEEPHGSCVRRRDRAIIFPQPHARLKSLGPLRTDAMWGRPRPRCADTMAVAPEAHVDLTHWLT
jgi:hypothetical protein